MILHFTRGEMATGLVWFRRDLRLADQTALAHALQHCSAVHCVFVFDTDILQPLPRADRRVAFIRESLVQLDARIRETAGRPECGLVVLHGRAVDEIPRLARQLGVSAVFTNRDYEPSAVERDRKVARALEGAGVAFHDFKDQVVLEAGEVLTQQGKPYTVFTPYSKSWLARLHPGRLEPQSSEGPAAHFAPRPAALRRGVPALQDLGFEPAAMPLPAGETGARQLLDDFLPRLDQYQAARDFPALRGPSYLGVHLRFGTVSIRELVALARTRAGEGAETWLKELVWREFYFHILATFPHVVTQSFKPEYDAIRWEASDELFAAWCEGRTGYPLVDAAMLQLNTSGYMHNRLRMVSASFLTKHLGIDWRRGERYFAEQLNDYDLAANNGGWQWAASTGCDAQPYFRIFNPVTQSERFDAQGRFIQRYLPQLAKLPAPLIHAPWKARPMELQAAGIRLGQDYPRPVVEHEKARELTLARYSAVRKTS